MIIYATGILPALLLFHLPYAQAGVLKLIVPSVLLQLRRDLLQLRRQLLVVEGLVGESLVRSQVQGRLGR